MTGNNNELTISEKFDRSYLLAEHQLMRDIEQSVCGCKYGGTSWTTKSEAEEMGQLLQLAPGKKYLEIGAGSGWPSLLLVKDTGCYATLTDISNEGLRIAEQRARDELIDDRCRFVVTEADQLQFANGEFDAIGHSDVLCCLEAKLETLTECRRVIRSDGSMVFSVIFISPGLSAEEYQLAVEAGPEFVAAENEYSYLLKQSGWKIECLKDITGDLVNTVSFLLRQQNKRCEELKDLMGVNDFNDFASQNHAKMVCLQKGLLQRAMFFVSPF
jgi:ubiquinone/menaquinone biosynthesis C-methylase UbiE